MKGCKQGDVSQYEVVCGVFGDVMVNRAGRTKDYLCKLIVTPRTQRL